MSELINIYADLGRLKAELWNAIEERLRAECGLSLHYLLAMLAIDRRDSCRVGDIAAELAMSVEAAGSLIDRMEAEGYCRRGEPWDWVRQALELTPRGRRLVAVARLAFDDELHYRFGSAVPAAVLGEFAAELRRLRRPRVATMTLAAPAAQSPDLPEADCPSKGKVPGTIEAGTPGSLSAAHSRGDRSRHRQ